MIERLDYDAAYGPRKQPLTETISHIGWDTVTTDSLKAELTPGDEAIRDAVVKIANSNLLPLIAQNFRQTPEGEHLGSMLRFLSYLPANCSAQQWRSILGAQASDLLHGEYTQITAGWILKAEGDRGLSDEQLQVERFLFTLTNLTHDWGEADPQVGDVPFGSVKPHLEEERVMHRKLAKSMLLQACQEYGTPVEVDSVEARAVEWIIDWAGRMAFEKPKPQQLRFDTELPEGFIYYSHLYRVNKYLGHFAVPLEVGRYLEEGGVQLARSGQIELHDKLNRLHTRVTDNALPVLLEYASHVKFIDSYLKAHRDEISTALIKARIQHPEDLQNYNDELLLTLGEVIERWQEYLETIDANEQA